MLRKLIPRSFKRALRRGHRAWVMRRAMRRIVEDPVSAVDDDACLQSLIYGWGNEGWSAEGEYLRHMVKLVASLKQQEVLECGSGLSTLLLASTAAKVGGHVTSLEHTASWAERIQKELEKYGLSASAKPRIAPLRSYGSYTWYEASDINGSFAAVVCDGPPSATPGGRYGLVPVMGSRLAPGCRLLLDDAGRDVEQEILRKWEQELGTTYRIFDGAKPFAEMTLP